MSITPARFGNGLWPRWLILLQSRYVATSASVISGSPSFKRMSVAIGPASGPVLPSLPNRPIYRRPTVKGRQRQVVVQLGGAGVPPACKLRQAGRLPHLTVPLPNDTVIQIRPGKGGSV